MKALNGMAHCYGENVSVSGIMCVIWWQRLAIIRSPFGLHYVCTAGYNE